MILLFTLVCGIHQAMGNGIRSQILSTDVVLDTSNCTWSDWSVCAADSIYRCSRTKTLNLLPIQNQLDNIPGKQFCNGGAGRMDTETCYDGLCPQWQTGNWTDCSNTCSHSQLPPWQGFQTRSLACMDSASVYYQSSVCENIYGLPSKPMSEQACSCSHQAVNIDPYANGYVNITIVYMSTLFNTSLADYLRSAYASLGLPPPQFSDSCKLVVQNIFIVEKWVTKSLQSSPDSYQATGGQWVDPRNSRNPLLKQFWIETDQLVDKSILDCIAGPSGQKAAETGVARSIYYKCNQSTLVFVGGFIPNLGFRPLDGKTNNCSSYSSQFATDSARSSNGHFSQSSSTGSSSTPTAFCRKVECMYRTNWNKKFPLGVSNSVHAKEILSPTQWAGTVMGGSGTSVALESMLWTVRQKCNNLDWAIEHYLGSTCPLDSAAIDELRGSESLSVLRSARVVGLATERKKVTLVVQRILKWIFADTELEELGLGCRVSQYINLPTRYDSVEIDCSPDSVVQFKLASFVFKKIIVPLISYLFYVTEDSEGEILYFRRPFWDVVVSKASLGLAELLRLEEVVEKPFGTSYTSTCSSQYVTGAKVRWIPKRSGGVRPVVIQPLFVKEKTRKLLLYLNAVRALRPDRLGCSVMTRGDCLGPMELFVKQISRNRARYAEKSPTESSSTGSCVESTNNSCDGGGCRHNNISPSHTPLYYFQADVQNCFESIPFGPLRESLHALADSSLKFSSVLVSIGRMFGSHPCKKKLVVFVKDDYQNLLNQVASTQAKSENPRVLIVHWETLSNERLSYASVVSSIFQIITNSVYRLPTGGSTTNVRKFKVTNQGLPQGHSISVMLVAVYYGWLDKKWTVRETTNSLCNAVTVRLVDDVLCLGVCENEVRRLASIIAEKEVYGKVNKAKVKMGQLDCSANSSITWAGLKIKPSQKGMGESLQLNFSIVGSAAVSKPMRKSRQSIDTFFKNFLARSLAQNSLPVLFSDLFNSIQCINANACQLGRIAGCRICQYVNACFQRPEEKELEKLIIKLTRFAKRRFRRHNTEKSRLLVLLKQFKYGFEKTLGKHNCE